MNCVDTTELLMDRLKGLLSAADDQSLEAHLAECAACSAEARSVTALWTDMGALDIEVPHERMRARFHAALAAYEERGGAFERFLEIFWPARPALGVALAASLLVAGVLIGRGLPSSTGGEIAALRSDVQTLGLALLDHQSASERLLGVAWAQRAESEPLVVDALLERVQFDPSLNVRLAAADALRTRIDRPEVGAGLAAALERQDSPLLQVTLAEALLESGRADGVAAVRRLLDRERLDPSVRDYLRTALQPDGAAAAPTPDV
jgi:anti-sigma factor RsiW